MSSTCNSRASFGLRAATGLCLAALSCSHVGVAPRVRAAGRGDDAVAAALADARSGNTLVRSVPADAELAVDGVPRGLASDYAGHGRLLALGPGQHEVALRRAGFAPVAVEVTVAPGDGRQTLDVVLPPLASP